MIFAYGEVEIPFIVSVLFPSKQEYLQSREKCYIYYWVCNDSNIISIFVYNLLHTQTHTQKSS